MVLMMKLMLSSSEFSFGTGNFTIEMFCYFNKLDDTYPTVLSKLGGSTLSWIVRSKERWTNLFGIAKMVWNK